MKKAIPEKVLKKDKRNTLWKSKVFDKEMVTASYFGFSPSSTPEIKKEDYNKLKTIKNINYDSLRIKKEFPFDFDPLEKISLLRSYEAWNLVAEPQPVFISYKKPLSGGEHKKYGDYTLGLEIFGLEESCAEAILIRSTLSILEDAGYRNLSVQLNCLGDKDSVDDFERMMTNFVRKNMNSFGADMRKALKKNVYELIRSTDPKYEKFKTEAPKSLSFLSENSRRRFMSVLEYIEGLDIPYSIDPFLIGLPEVCSHTLFRIVDGENNTLATSYQYSRISKKIGLKKGLPSIGLTLSYKKKNQGRSIKNLTKPKFFLVQLSQSAKMKTLVVVETLRQAKICLAHSLAKDKLQSQLGTAENLKVPYVLIIGQKEALENCVVVRDIATRVQETVPISELVKYLKNIAR